VAPFTSKSISRKDSKDLAKREARLLAKDSSSTKRKLLSSSIEFAESSYGVPEKELNFPRDGQLKEVRLFDNECYFCCLSLPLAMTYFAGRV
jgi:hypothetical protein